MSIQWHGEEFKKHLNAEIIQRLRTACEVVRATAVKSLNVTAHVRTRRRDAQGRFKSATVGYEPSKPGQPPRWRTRTLIGSVFYDVDESEQAGIVGTPVDYGRHLELGTTNMAARPWLRPSLYRNLQRITKILTKKLPKG